MTSTKMLGDRFTIGEPLGSGGMGSIFRGRDTRLGEDVAIKILKRSLLGDAVLRERFRREAVSLAKLRHPGIVKVLDFGESADTGDLYTVLDLVRGTTLSEALRVDTRIHVLRAAPIFDQVLSALEVCHAADVIHRDIKPSNIMLSPHVDGTDHVTIIDFGLAHVSSVAEKLTETGVVHGTPHYMAPEQCRGEEVSSATDVYASGVVFYEMLSGATPFVGKDAATFMAQHLFVDPPPLREVAAASHVSAGVAAAIHSALAKKPDDRPSARDFRHLLVSAFKGTDPETLAETSSIERRRASGLSRSDRAITGRADVMMAEHATSDAATVIVWMVSDAQSASVRGSLGAAGIASSLWTSNDVPAGNGDAIILPFARLDAIKVLRAKDPKLPVLVIDVNGPDETTAAIRAGASDMLLREASDADLAPKIKKLVARRKRTGK